MLKLVLKLKPKLKPKPKLYQVSIYTSTNVIPSTISPEKKWTESDTPIVRDILGKTTTSRNLCGMSFNVDH